MGCGVVLVVRSLGKSTTILVVLVVRVSWLFVVARDLLDNLFVRWLSSCSGPGQPDDQRTTRLSDNRWTTKLTGPKQPGRPKNQTQLTQTDLTQVRLQKGVWRNGRASDSRSKNWECESLCPQTSARAPVVIWSFIIRVRCSASLSTVDWQPGITSTWNNTIENGGGESMSGVSGSRGFNVTRKYAKQSTFARYVRAGAQQGDPQRTSSKRVDTTTRKREVLAPAERKTTSSDGVGAGNVVASRSREML